MAVFNTVLGEELLFRGLLLPRMRGVFGRGDWVANGVLFAAYHVHMPWAIPKALLDTLALAYPSRRYTSAWLGIMVHSLQSVVIVGALVALVVAVDVAFFRGHFWPRLTVNVGIVLVFLASYLRFLRKA